MTGLLFDPLLSWPVIAAIAALSAVVVGLALWRGLVGWWLRALAALCLIAALLNPAAQSEVRNQLSNIVIAVIDRSASQQIGDRPDQTDAALAHIRAEIATLPNTELREVVVGDGADDQGTLLLGRVAQALADEPVGRIAGVIAVTDGRLHDAEMSPAVPAPVHVLLTGRDSDWDRRLVVSSAPSFAIIGETVSLSLRVEDVGAAPQDTALVPLTIAIDGAAPLSFEVPRGQDIDLPISLPHGGLNVLEFATPIAQGELTGRNNAAVIQMNGVRDRLRVMLVSGEPHAGERTWRNLLKSDSAVDLVHFTILRPPEKHDGVPVDELSLIAFPTRELFLEKLFDFDLIIFDRYRRRGLLPNAYLENVRDYVANGGAVLVSSGPEFATADSIFQSPLGEVMPAVPTATVSEAPYLPTITDLGRKHPVTENLDNGDVPWGRWLRYVDVVPNPDAEIVMTGPDDRPLLILDRVDQGRIALLASDHAWLWDRGYEGGGPQQELLRRLAHWLMKEPDLEEEALWAEVDGETLTIIRRTLGDPVASVTVTGPDGANYDLTLDPATDGRFQTTWAAPQLGLYRITDGTFETVAGIGPASPREYENPLASADLIAPLMQATGGIVTEIQTQLPDIRLARSGSATAGNGWIGLLDRQAYETAELRVVGLVPAWLFLLMAAGLMIGAWLREGRR